MAETVSTFISYSRNDTDFVDRLEADLRARGFKTWVDRRKLEGTREWQPQIDHAINEYPIMIVVLSPDAIASQYVRHEYEHAHQLGKRIVTLLQKPNLPTVPPELSEMQWVDFVNRPYEAALVELIDGCQDPSFDQASDPRTLYNQAHDLESTDPERATILYQRLINRAPTYSGGRAQTDLDRLNRQLYSQRAQGLREQAEAANKEGQYGAEAGALAALIALGDHDRATFTWAKEYLVVAQQNSKWLDTYENVKHFVAKGDVDSARDLLTYLWQMENAPFFRDPADIASSLGLKVPITYEQWKEERQESEERTKQQKAAAAERDRLIMQAESNANRVASEEMAKWQAACVIVRGDLRKVTSQEVAQLREWNTAASDEVRSLLEHWQQQTSIEQKVAKSHTGITESLARFATASIVKWFAILSIVIAVILLVISLGDAASFLTALALLAVVILVVIFLWRLAALHNRANQSQDSLSGNEIEITALANQWVRLAEKEYTRRLSSIQTDLQRLSDDAQAQYQQGMDAIAAEHARTLAEIEARYAGG
jgi:hypothetical protein